MNSETREQTLSDFMECTGLEDVEECIHILDQHQWNLLNAVQIVHERLGGGGDTHYESTIPKHSTAAASNRSTTTKPPSVVKKPLSSTINHKRHSDSDDNNDSDEPRIIKSLPGSTRTTKTTTGATSRVPVRELNFTVEYIDHTEHITMLDNETIRQLQTKIYDKLHIPPQRQKFSNWTSRQYTENTVLRELQLPKENVIHLIATATSISNGANRSSTNTTNASAANRTNRYPTTSPKTTTATASSQFSITVVYEEKSKKPTPYELLLKPTTTVGELKKEFEQIAHLPVRQQYWADLTRAKDTDQLRQISSDRKIHLKVRRTDLPSNQKSPSSKTDSKQPTLTKHTSEDDAMDVDHVIDLEAYDDDVNSAPIHLSKTTSANSTASNRELLIPERCTDDTVGLEHFSRVFHARYGSTGPILYIGSLEKAIQESLYTSINERRPLAIYIHSDRSVCANVFCAQVLASETIVEYLANNFVVWAWDITTDANRTRLIETIKRCIGNQYAHRVSLMEKDAFPILFLVTRSRNSLEMINMIEGKSTPSEALLTLIQSHDLYEQQKQRDAEEERSRVARETIIKEQEHAYNESIQADIAKEEARLADERKRKEEHDANERIIKEKLRKQEESKSRLPQEPSETDKDITRLKIRLPNDEGILLRRFRLHENLQVLFDYLTSQGHPFGEYKLLSAYPKRDLTQLNQLDTFEQLKLYPQEQLILENL